METDGMTMHYKAIKVPTLSPALSGYGLHIARSMAFPETFLKFAEQNQKQLIATNNARQAAQQQSQQALARKKSVVDLYEALVHLSDMPGELDETTLRKWLLHLQYKFIDSVS